MITNEQIKEMQDAPELAVWEAIQAYNKARDYLNDKAIITRYLPELEDMNMDLSNKLSQHFLDVSA